MLGLCTVNSFTGLTATTPRKRTPPESDHFVKNQFNCLSFKYCFKFSLVSDHCLNFLNDRDYFVKGKKYDIFFCFLFIVSDREARSIPDGFTCKKTVARVAQKFSSVVQC